jgi:hypothetical protein
MAEAELNLKRPVSLTEEDDGTLAAIDRGVRDADGGCLTAIEKLEKMLPQWISKSSFLTKPQATSARSSSTSHETTPRRPADWVDP